MSEYANLLIEDREGARIITINRPKALNALNPEVLNELDQALHSAAADTSVGVVIITGSGDRAFVAGADIKHMQDINAADAYAFASIGHRVFQYIESMPKPVIAAVNGVAFGGGSELALACDFIYASNKARFGLPEVKLGLMPGFGGTQRLMRKIPQGMARELVYTGEPILADEAHRLGLVNKVTEPEALLDACLESAKKILARSHIAVASAKKVMVDGADMTLPQACSVEINTFALLFASDHPKEGVSAFLEKREPKFSK
ncbi:MAG: enoyl-CoA hydratase/isomerase family protein [Myxococcales bacterium]|nr:enoyl-CoA hydratase/isomerase family protein [Myxococcales bacterium]